MTKRNDFKRVQPLPSLSKELSYRSDYRRDYARVLHSSSFRRLGNKTQLFPGYESDFFRTRLTHSLEVAQIAKSIALKLKQENKSRDIESDVCEIAGLIHDVGHPPFGHNGEKALDYCMREHGGFEGNAQTIRIITRLEKKDMPYCGCKPQHGSDCRVGLNLTARVIASALKYDYCIPLKRGSDSGSVKGYYDSEKEIISQVKEAVLGHDLIDIIPFKTIECSIMDLADDIAYSTYDIEDAFKAGFLTPFDLMGGDVSIFTQIKEKLKQEIDGIDEQKIEERECRMILWELFADVWEDFVLDQKNVDLADENYDEFALANILSSYTRSLELASDGYKRTAFTSGLVNRFIEGVEFEENPQNPQLSTVKFNEKTEILVNILKHFTHISLINSSRLKVVENRGYDIIVKIFEKLNGKDGHNLLPPDFQKMYNDSDNERERLICDFIAGMTDRYALEFYCRLYSENPETIFKPL